MTASRPEGNISIPLVIDTEFWTFRNHWTSGIREGRLGITTQIKGIAASRGVIFTHPDSKDFIGRHKVTASGFDAIDYLNAVGVDASIRRVDEVPKGTPVAEVVLIGHFLLAEAMMMVKGDFRADIDAFMRTNSPNKPRIEMQRRLRAVTPSPAKKGNSRDYDYIQPNWIATIQGQDYVVRIVFIDTCALHGMASYKELAESVGVELTDKENFTDPEKEQMLLMAINRAEDFDAYALGDLEVYEMLEANAALFRKVYEQLGILESYKAPRLTIGSTVNDIFLAVLKKHLGADEDLFKQVQSWLLPASASSLKVMSNSTVALNAKVFGGRCRNNRPTNTCLICQVIVDLDIAGCYGEGQRNQMYFIGKPEVLEYPANSANNAYMTLGTWLDGGKLPDGKRWSGIRSELFPGGWQAIVSSTEALKFPQDFLASWFVNGSAKEDLLAKYVSRSKSDSEQVDNDFDVEDGDSKILNHEVHNAVITHDFLQWLDFICSAQQRKELLEKLVVKTAMYYPASMRCNSFTEYINALKEHSGKNTVTRSGKGKKARISQHDGECHAWYAVNIGGLIIDDLLVNRKVAQEVHGKKSPLDVLYKLCINTLYGDMVSKFFDNANVIVGNNITGRARALAWYMEKGLNGFQTITDGCQFDLNRVVYPKDSRRVTAVELVNLYRRQGNNNVRMAPIGSHVRLGAIGAVERIELNWVPSGDPKTPYDPQVTLHTIEGQTVLTGKQALNWINTAAMEHLQMLFPGVDVLHAETTSLKPVILEDKLSHVERPKRLGQFSFEAKDYYDNAMFHGTSNYLLENPNPKGKNLKMRSYETKKLHESVQLNSGSYEVTSRYGRISNPAVDFMPRLKQPEAVARQDAFVKDAILKPGDYKNRIDTWSKLGLVPGDSYYKSGLLREFSISQFTFKTLEQYLGWSKAIGIRKDKLGQSLEQFFLNDDGSLNYAQMVKTVDQLIADDCMNPFTALDPNRNQAVPHPAFGTLTAIREYLATPETRLEYND
jgi:hypothetical protein